MPNSLVSNSTALQPIRIVLVDDHRIVLLGLQKLIEGAAPRMQVEATAVCGADALVAVKQHRPDIVLLDHDLGDEDGFELLAPMRELGSKVIVLTAVPGALIGENAMRAGASGLVHKSQPAEVVLQAIERVYDGELWLDRGTTAKVFESLLAAEQESRIGHHVLTAAERKIIAAVAEYKTLPNKQIAAALCISTHTLRNHLASIYRKLGVHRRFELVLYAMEHGLNKGTHSSQRRVA
jgi:two-component system nitrate/nitrite response regulator NarL